MTHERKTSAEATLSDQSPKPHKKVADLVGLLFELQEQGEISVYERDELLLDITARLCDNLAAGMQGISGAALYSSNVVADQLTAHCISKLARLHPELSTPLPGQR